MTWRREAEDLRGRQYGRWTVVRRLYPSEDPRAVGKHYHPPVRWRCRCACGRMGIVTSCDLKRGQSAQCEACRREREYPDPAAKLAGVSA